MKFLNPYQILKHWRWWEWMNGYRPVAKPFRRFLGVLGFDIAHEP